MADEQIKFRIDLDAKPAIDAVGSLQSKINDIGNSKGITDLIQNFSDVAGPIMVAGTALFAFKKSFDFAIEGEQLSIAAPTQVKKAIRSVKASFLSELAESLIDLLDTE